MSATWIRPEQYLATLPKATVYACFYLTDRNNRPLQLRAAHDPSVWQMPGGNLDGESETPWDCAVREFEEETGLRAPAEPHLLAVHSLPPLDDWPLRKIGFLFDGGQLDQDQIDRIVLDPNEHTELAVHSLQEWRTEMNAPSYHRLAAVAEARHTGAACYLEQPATS